MIKKPKKKEKTQTYWRKKCVAKAKEQAKERDKFCCQRCGRTKEQGYQIHGSHVYSEGKYKGMSADVQNIKAMCAQCHMWWHENPIQSKDWYAKKFPERLKYLKKQAQKILKIDWKKEYESIH